MQNARCSLLCDLCQGRASCRIIIMAWTHICSAAVLYLRTPSSEVTKRNSTPRRRMFESEPDLKMVVHNLVVSPLPPYTRGPTAAPIWGGFATTTRISSKRNVLQTNEKKILLNCSYLLSVLQYACESWTSANHWVGELTNLNSDYVRDVAGKTK